MGELGNYYHHEYGQGTRGVIDALRAEEGNLLHARRLALRYARATQDDALRYARDTGVTQDDARTHGWWHRVTSAMQGLDTLYDHTGRRAEWARLVKEIVPDFVDAETGGPRPGREERWSLVTEYRVRLAREARQWTEAERLQQTCVAWDRQRAAEALARPAEALDNAGRNTIRTLAASLHGLGEIQRERQEQTCVTSYQGAADLLGRIGDRTAEAIAALNLGHAYLTLPTLRDLAQAEIWYRRSLALRAEGDRLGRSKCHQVLGYVALERFKEAREAGRPEAERLAHLNEALGSYHRALDMLPEDAVDDRAVAHNQLGLTYSNVGDAARALQHYQESIRYQEAQGNVYGAAQTRFNVAIMLAQAGRAADALAYARAALRGFETYGAGAEEEVQKTERLIAAIEGMM